MKFKKGDYFRCHELVGYIFDVVSPKDIYRSPFQLKQLSKKPFYLYRKLNYTHNKECIEDNFQVNSPMEKESEIISLDEAMVELL